MKKMSLAFIEFAHYRSVLCLNGHLPPKTFFTNFTNKLPVIAADGAANLLVQMGIRPQMIIGDLDSVTPEVRAQFPTLHYPDQNSCDFEKALGYLKQQQLLPCIVTGINGGYLDHILNNINIFSETDNILYAPPLVGYKLAAPTNKTLVLPLNTKISLIAMPSAVITTQGLKWELTQYQADFIGKNSCFNRTIAEEVRIEIESGSVLVLIYQTETDTVD